jgi:hypothetical protein
MWTIFEANERSCFSCLWKLCPIYFLKNLKSPSLDIRSANRTSPQKLKSIIMFYIFELGDWRALCVQRYMRNGFFSCCSKHIIFNVYCTVYTTVLHITNLLLILDITFDLDPKLWVPDPNYDPAIGNTLLSYISQSGHCPKSKGGFHPWKEKFHYLGQMLSTFHY